LVDFLEKHRKELNSMLANGWDWDRAMNVAVKIAGREGYDKGVRNTALSLKRDGVPVSVISRATNLSVSAIRRLKT